MNTNITKVERHATAFADLLVKVATAPEARRSRVVKTVVRGCTVLERVTEQRSNITGRWQRVQA